MRIRGTHETGGPERLTVEAEFNPNEVDSVGKVVVWYTVLKVPEDLSQLGEGGEDIEVGDLNGLHQLVVKTIVISN